MTADGGVRDAVPGGSAVTPIGPRSPRLAWVDGARGVGILLVVLGHALGGMIDAGQAPPGHWFRPLFLVIYTIHMPLFFALSGLFVQARLARQPAGFLRGVLRTIAWPYFLWSALQLTVILLAGSVVNAPLAGYWGQLVALPLIPVAQFWFLYGILLLHVLSVLVLPRLGAVALVLVGFGLASLAARGVLPSFLADTGSMAPYYATGVWIGGMGAAGMRPGRGLVVLSGAAAILAVGLATTLTMAGLGEGLAGLKAPDIAHIAFGFPNVFAALPAVFAIGCLMAAAGERLRGPLPYLGRHSLSVYVLHVMFVAGTRIMLLKGLHLTNPLVVLATLVAIGVAGPVLVYEAARRARLAGVLGLS